MARPIPAIFAALAVEKRAQVPDRVRVAVIAVAASRSEQKPSEAKPIVLEQDRR